ncbi:unnamed protein product [Urochloa decumbens]|uniref:DUF6598 domain-containing protein n=1 Tax=Urochloa decumbens TaxID=240449 RepID=A0ABC9GGA8_9POAL
MEIERGGSGSAETLGPGRGKKRPPPLRGDEEVEDSPESTTMDPDDDWSVSDGGSEEEEGHDNGDQRMYPHFTIDNFPRATCDHEKQTDLLYANPRTKLHGPKPTRLFPAFKSGEHVFGSDYNLDDKSEITVSNAGDCSNGCQCLSMDLLQFIDAKIAGYELNRPGRAKIFGFVAARDTIKPLRNYVYRRDIDNCEAVSVKRKTGVARLSLISPTRVIEMSSRALIEFELHAPNEDGTKGDDAPIIEGCTQLYNMFASKSFVEHRRMYGERCALDIKYMVLMNAVEARVEVKVLHLGAIDGGVNMRLLAKTSGFSEVIRLFRGAAPKPGFMMSFAIAVERRSGFDLYIEGFPGDDPATGQKPVTYSCWKCGFASSYHRMDEEVAELGEFASVSVKVTWKSYTKKTSQGVQNLV